MFESAELDHKLSKAEFDAVVPDLRAKLLDMQVRLGRQNHFGVLVLINGVDGAGKGETVNVLNAWMDPRHIRTHAFGTPTEEEILRPFMWRFWRALPPRGSMGILFGSWYSEPILRRVERDMGRAEMDARIDEINHFERMLAQEGVLILKFWFHLAKDVQRRRLRALEKNPLTRWRVTNDDWNHFAHYDRFREVSEHVLRQTSTGHAPWVVVEGADERYRSVYVGRVLLDAITKRLDADAAEPSYAMPVAPIAPPPLDGVNLLNRLQPAQTYPPARYARDMEQLQGRLAMLVRRKGFDKHSLVVVFEGMDAAGKGSAIRRVTGALDARVYRVVPIAAPTEEEKALPYLWRFWRHVPRRGRLAIFDRSWYGRVLVERVEGFCTEADWMRAYNEINDFEDQLAKSGAVIVKFWLAVSPTEQLRRFDERAATPFKHFKITEEDWRNRDKWPQYVPAVCDMIDRTSTEVAPWTLVEADNKLFARAKVLRTLCERLESALK
ncbi:MAG: polyphosphate:AMP phosphotransferase [Rhodocyclaceae bacterium]|nr:polyphosphate:AMP phosphotransferase [Rhodocyclaceae bacterium]MBX3667113.1 polyphosphate:AMP phosphotransferase [Rhodocyclaceae bacterium]